MPAIHKKIENFYHSTKWQKVRKLKIQKEHGICERCGKVGNEVHHIKYLTLTNIEDQEITLGLDNLELLCKNCHNVEHNRYTSPQISRGIAFDSRGDMIYTPPTLKRKI